MPSEDYNSETLQVMRDRADAELDRLVAAGIRDATPEELKAQREGYAANYKPGPRQAIAFMPFREPLDVAHPLKRDFSGADCVIAVKRLMRGVGLTVAQVDEIIRELNLCLGGHHAGSAGTERE